MINLHNFVLSNTHVEQDWFGNIEMFINSGPSLMYANDHLVSMHGHHLAIMHMCYTKCALITSATIM